MFLHILAHLLCLFLQLEVFFFFLFFLRFFWNFTMVQLNVMKTLPSRLFHFGKFCSVLFVSSHELCFVQVVINLPLDYSFNLLHKIIKYLTYKRHPIRRMSSDHIYQGFTSAQLGTNGISIFIELSMPSKCVIFNVEYLHQYFR